MFKAQINERTDSLKNMSLIGIPRWSQLPQKTSMWSAQIFSGSTIIIETTNCNPIKNEVNEKIIQRESVAMTLLSKIPK